MGVCKRHDNPRQGFLLPPSLKDWLPDDHLVWFIADTVDALELVEPPFGWIKAVQGFRQFLLRGIDKVSAEWNLVCSAMNLERMATRMEWA
jgi:hypothetical protein